MRPFKVNFQTIEGPKTWAGSATRCSLCDRKVTGEFSKIGDDGKVRAKKADSIFTQKDDEGWLRIVCFDCYSKCLAKAMAPTQEELADEQY